MKNLLKLEELAMFILSFLAFMYLGGTWYGFLIFLLAPDASMIGYIFGPKLGAVTYNLVHHKGTAILLFVIGIFIQATPLILASLILLAHSSMDRVLGYGLKFPDDFKHTHLGRIGK